MQTWNKWQKEGDSMNGLVETINRNECWLTGKNDLEELYCFPDFPVHMMAEANCTATEDIRMDLRFCISRESGAVQISDLIPQHVLYKDAHFQTAHSGVWRQHNRELAEEIAALGTKSVFEIGGGTGVLEREYARLGQGGAMVYYGTQS